MVRRVAKEIKNLPVNRVHDRELTRCAARYLTGRMLDIGACEGCRKAVDEFKVARGIWAYLNHVNVDRRYWIKP